MAKRRARIRTIWQIGGNRAPLRSEARMHRLSGTVKASRAAQGRPATLCGLPFFGDAAYLWQAIERRGIAKHGLSFPFPRFQRYPTSQNCFGSSFIRCLELRRIPGRARVQAAVSLVPVVSASRTIAKLRLNVGIFSCHNSLLEIHRRPED